MHISNSYSLQRKMEYKKGWYEKSHNISLILKILFLLSIIAAFISFWFFTLSGFLLVCDIVLSYFRSKMVYTFVYGLSDGVFTVKKVDLDGKVTIVESLPAKEIKSCLFVELRGDEKCYFNDYDDFGEDIPLLIETEDTAFAVLSDKYLYSILRYAMEIK